MNVEVIRNTAHKFNAEKFYGVLFKSNPELRSLFPEDMGKQYAALTNAVQFVVVHLEDEDKLVALLVPLGARHVQYGATPERYDAVGRAILESMELESPEEKAAWAQAFTFIRSVMIRGAKEAAEGSEGHGAN